MNSIISPTELPATAIWGKCGDLLEVERPAATAPLTGSSRSPARNEVISNPCHRHDFPPSPLRTQAMPLTPVRFLCLLPERQLM